MQFTLILVACLVACCMTQSPVYIVKTLNKQETSYSGTLQLVSGKGPYGSDIADLKFAVLMDTEDRVHVKIGDIDGKRWEVPFVIDETKPKHLKAQPQYNIRVADIGKPFALEITRASNNDLIFNTTGRLVFSDQYLELTTQMTNKHEPNIYGLGERVHALRLDPRNNSYVIWNQDNANQENKNLYGTHPFYLEQRNDGNAHGAFFLNSNAMEFVSIWNDRNKQLQFRAIGGIIDFYVFLGPNPKAVVQQYHDLIGTPHLVPKWSLGFHQCRWGYKSVDETRSIVQKYKENNLPLDTMWNDIDYMDGFRVFTFDPNNFAVPKMQQFVDELHSNGQKYMCIVDPGVKVDPGYHAYDLGLQMDIYIKKADGKTPIRNKVWPGITTFPDFTYPKAIEYWKTLVVEWLNTVPIDGMWIDMNELATFCDGECDKEDLFDPINPPYVPPNLKLDKQQLTMNSVMNASTWYNAHSLYGFREGYASRQALEERYPNKRPVIISRSSFASSGRYHSHWLGDNDSTWKSMWFSIPGMLNFNMFGISLVGADICGFNGDTNKELCTRWMQLGSFYPFSRNHNTVGAKSQEPYVFGDDTTKIARAALQNRYALLPYYYTLFFRAHEQGSTVVRPLFFEYPTDIQTFAIDTQFLVGPALLVSPVLQEGATSVNAYIPPGNAWYDYYTGDLVKSTGQVTLDAPIEKINAHVRGGYIIPRQQDALTTVAQRNLPYNLIVAVNNGSAQGELYLDDDESLDSVDSKKYSLIEYNLANTSNSFVLKNNAVQHGYDYDVEMDRVEFYGVGSVCKAQVNGQSAQFSTQGSIVVVSTPNVRVLDNLTVEVFNQC